MFFLISLCQGEGGKCVWCGCTTMAWIKAGWEASGKYRVMFSPVSLQSLFERWSVMLRLHGFSWAFSNYIQILLFGMSIITRGFAVSDCHEHKQASRFSKKKTNQKTISFEFCSIFLSKMDKNQPGLPYHVTAISQGILSCATSKKLASHSYPHAVSSAVKHPESSASYTSSQMPMIGWCHWNESGEKITLLLSPRNHNQFHSLGEQPTDGCIVLLIDVFLISVKEFAFSI